MTSQEQIGYFKTLDNVSDNGSSGLTRALKKQVEDLIVKSVKHPKKKKKNMRSENRTKRTVYSNLNDLNNPST